MKSTTYFCVARLFKPRDSRPIESQTAAEWQERLIQWYLDENYQQTSILCSCPASTDQSASNSQPGATESCQRHTKRSPVQSEAPVAARSSARRNEEEYTRSPHRSRIAALQPLCAAAAGLRTQDATQGRERVGRTPHSGR